MSYLLRIAAVKPKMSMIDHGVAKKVRCRVIRVDDDGEAHTIATLYAKGWRSGVAVERVTAAGNAAIERDKAKRAKHLRAQIEQEK